MPAAGTLRSIALQELPINLEYFLKIAREPPSYFESSRARELLSYLLSYLKGCFSTIFLQKDSEFPCLHQDRRLFQGGHGKTGCNRRLGLPNQTREVQYWQKYKTQMLACQAWYLKFSPKKNVAAVAVDANDPPPIACPPPTVLRRGILPEIWIASGPQRWWDCSKPPISNKLALQAGLS
jgi:hypothetical protein